jgi:hypothetical protein
VQCNQNKNYANELDNAEIADVWKYTYEHQQRAYAAQVFA